jgi:flagellin
MALPINNHLFLLNNGFNLRNSSHSVARELAILSAGMRITRAGDDAAGLAIAENLDAQQRGYSAGLRNTNDGLSLLQTADGAAASVGENLKRMKELAVQSASETLSDEQRGAIQTEYEQLQEEITRTANTTEWNGQNTGTGQTTSVQTGAESSEQITLKLGDLRADSLGVDSASISLSTAAGAQDAIEAIDDALTSVNEIRAENGATQNTLVSRINNLNAFTETLSATESIIRDADYAYHASEMMRDLMLRDANLAVQAQASTLTQGAVSLLG